MPPSALSQLDSLPTYLGSKRSLVVPIFEALEAAGAIRGQGLTLLDPFMGGGSVSLTAKLLGYRTISNDVSIRSQVIGDALIANSDKVLSDEDLALVMDTDPGSWHRPEEKKMPMPKVSADLLRATCAAREQFEDPAKRGLLGLLMVKTALSLAMWGQLRSGAGHRVREENWDKMTAGQAASAPAFFQPRAALVKAAEAINAGVVDNGEANEMHRGDVLEFLADRQADAVYLDPPYPGTLAYEDQYAALDELLLNREIPVEKSRFSAKEGWKFLDDVYAAAEHIPIWVLSLGNETVDIDTLAEQMRERGRDVRTIELEYRHLESQASKAKNDENREFILTASKRRGT